MFTARAPLYSCLTVSQFVNTSDSGELTQQARQRAGDWFLIQASVDKRSPEPCGISGSVSHRSGVFCLLQGPLGQKWKGGGMERSAAEVWKSWALVLGVLLKEPRPMLIMVSDIWVQGCHCRSPNLTLNDWHDMLWGGSQHVDTRK